MTTQKSALTILDRTIVRMKTKDHLPQDLVSLLDRIATLQLKTRDGLDPDLKGLDLSRFPLCRPGQFPRDMDHIRSMAEKVLDHILEQPEAMPPAMVSAAKILAAGLDNRTLDLDGALTEVLECDKNWGKGNNAKTDTAIMAAWAAQTPGAPSAPAFLVLAAAAPWLEACGAALAQAADLDHEQIHSTGSCPVCGSAPYILELRGKEGARYARCSLCRYTYRIRRMACASCDTDAPDQLKYFTADGETGFRVETCDACKTYVKTIDFRNLDREIFAPLNDLESLALDLLAQDQGYLRSGPPVWGI